MVTKWHFGREHLLAVFPQSMRPRRFPCEVRTGRTIIHLAPKETFFSQGDAADSVFYLQEGRAKVTVVSPSGREATIAFLSAGDFVGEEVLVAMAGLRLATATAITACITLRIGRKEMIRVMHVEHSFSDLFLKVMLDRSMRIRADLVDQLFNSSEQRLARILLLMAEFGKPGEPDQYIPKISQKTLAEMIGTTRSRVSFFILHESISQTRVYRIRRTHQGSQVSGECGPAR